MKRVILVVDDDTTSLKLANKILGQEYRVATVSSGATVFDYLTKNTPDLILLDLNMPHIDGMQVMERIQGDPALREIPVIFLTAEQDPASEARCLESGAIDFVAKPFVPAVLMSRVKRTLELMDYRRQLETMVDQQSRLISLRTERIADIQNSVIVGMANLIESRDNSTGRHVKNTQMYVELICSAIIDRGLFKNQMTEEYKNHVVKSAPLHDVGKIKIPDAILQKPGELTKEEFEVIKMHPVYGAEIIDDILGDVENPDYLSVARDMCHYHHEYWDGRGYPEGLSRDEIPLCARIMAIADVFDALYEERCYKEAIPFDTTMSIIEDNRGIQFDPEITDVFVGCKDELKQYLQIKED